MSPGIIFYQFFLATVLHLSIGILHNVHNSDPRLKCFIVFIIIYSLLRHSFHITSSFQSWVPFRFPFFLHHDKKGHLISFLDFYHCLLFMNLTFSSSLWGLILIWKTNSIYFKAFLNTLNKVARSSSNSALKIETISLRQMFKNRLIQRRNNYQNLIFNQLFTKLIHTKNNENKYFSNKSLE